MRRIRRVFSVALCAMVPWAMAGCTKPGPPSNAPTTAKKADDHDDHDHHDHDHPTHGPHGGSLIELGEEEYHAELVHDEKSQTVTIHILDGAAKEAVAIEAESVTINLTHDGKPAQFTLAAANAQEGKASSFSSNDAKLAEALDAENAKGRLLVDIAGKSYSGEIAHSHDDHDHDHDHDHKSEKKPKE